jgi:hypothetical protein
MPVARYLALVAGMPSEQEAQQMVQAALGELRLFDVLCPRVFALISFLHRLNHLFLHYRRSLRTLPKVLNRAISRLKYHANGKQ